MSLHKKVLPNEQNMHLVRSTLTTDDWVTINVDGVVSNCDIDDVVHNLCRAGCGGIVRNALGGWIKGFPKFLGSCNNYVHC